jgi:uncharacterized protein YyaL (SSP411 family)
MSNHLANQTSPYLIQHADNPVDWYPWSKDALDLAQRQSKPILLSIGYSACHWCHVMERESFENEVIAEFMNTHFVCIKVDREERPDLDKIYQIAHQMLTRRPGGWPLTVVLTPDGHAPFFAGTYFPAEPRYNMPGFGDVLEKISTHYRNNKESLSSHHVSFRKALEQLVPQPGSTGIPDPVASLVSAAGELQKQYDSEYGGFGDAPKFPHPTQLELLLTAAGNTALPISSSCRDIVINTLEKMSQGGLFDHLAGGFFRYSVDRKWQIPHFEKMLYDNAQLLTLYCDACQLFENSQFSDTAIATARWVVSDMQLHGGGYAATLDADSEGEEGKFYVWSETDLRAILSEKEYSILENYFGLFGEANFDGSWHFNVNPETNFDLLADNPDLIKTIATAKARLLEIRNQRPSPGLDDKILTAWNGLMIKGMARAGRVLGRQEFIQSATDATNFVRSNMWQGNRMLATCSQGMAQFNGYLDDYAFMLDGVIELLQSKWTTPDLLFAIDICDAMLDRFEDIENGGFYFTSHDHEKLLYRPKYGADDAIPSGNGVAIQCLLKLGNLLGDNRYLQAADRAFAVFASELDSHPSVNGSMTSALLLTGDLHTTVIIRGDEESSAAWKEYCNKFSQPLLSIYMIDKDAKNLPPALALRKAQEDTVAYVCTGNHCSPAITSLPEFMAFFSHS